MRIISSRKSPWTIRVWDAAIYLRLNESSGKTSNLESARLTSGLTPFVYVQCISRVFNFKRTRCHVSLASHFMITLESCHDHQACSDPQQYWYTVFLYSETMDVDQYSLDNSIFSRSCVSKEFSFLLQDLRLEAHVVKCRKRISGEFLNHELQITSYHALYGPVLLDLVFSIFPTLEVETTLQDSDKMRRSTRIGFPQLLSRERELWHRHGGNLIKLRGKFGQIKGKNRGAGQNSVF